MKTSLRALMLCSTLALLAACGCTSARSSSAESKGAPHLTDWPAGKSPAEIGDRVSQRFLEVPWQLHGTKPEPRVVNYPEVCAWYGALTFAKETGNSELRDKL